MLSVCVANSRSSLLCVFILVSRCIDEGLFEPTNVYPFEVVNATDLLGVPSIVLIVCPVYDAVAKFECDFGFKF